MAAQQAPCLKSQTALLSAMLGSDTGRNLAQLVQRAAHVCSDLIIVHIRNLGIVSPEKTNAYSTAGPADRQERVRPPAGDHGGVGGRAASRLPPARGRGDSHRTERPCGPAR